ncbi:MAG: aldo/keto reductase, partial [Anaerolineales bacterium]|nr:aldo/keto reductase [Anaerolineales bacterium]
MRYKLLGRSGVRVSELCFGTMSFGGDADEETSAAMFRRCLDAGVNFFDTADVYSGGRSEEILGRLSKALRDDLVITSKFYGPTGPGLNDKGASRRHIQLAVEGSLRRLQTDRIDVYFIHNFDYDTPLEETLRGLDDLVRAGKILYPAASNYAAWQVMKALGLAALHGWARYECLQPMYNLVKRQAEVEILPMAQSEGLGVIPYSPLGGGLLTGKYGREKRPDAGRLTSNAMYQRRYGADANYDAAEDFTALAQELGHDPASLAVAWVGSHPGVTAPIIGARNLNQLEGSLNAVNIDMTPELRARISALTPAPALAHDREEE